MEKKTTGIWIPEELTKIGLEGSYIIVCAIILYWTRREGAYKGGLEYLRKWCGDTTDISELREGLENLEKWGYIAKSRERTEWFTYAYIFNENLLKRLEE